MAYSLQSITQQVRDKLDDQDYPEAVIRNFVNETQQEIFNGYELPFNQDTFSGTLSEGEHRFNFVSSAPDYQRVVSLRLVDEDIEQDISDYFVTYRDFRKRFPTPEFNTPKRPRHWTSYGFVIIFSAPTDKPYTMDMDYIKEADLLEDTDAVPELPQSWQEVLVLGTFIRALERNDDLDIAEYHRSKQGGYIDQVQRLMNRYNPSQTAKARTLRQTSRRR